MKNILITAVLSVFAQVAFADGPLSIKGLRGSEWRAGSAPVFRSMAIWS